MLISGHFRDFCGVSLFGSVRNSGFAQVAHGNSRCLSRTSKVFRRMKINSKQPSPLTHPKRFRAHSPSLSIWPLPPVRASVTHLGHRNKWRNAVAHQKPTRLLVSHAHLVDGEPGGFLRGLAYGLMVPFIMNAKNPRSPTMVKPRGGINP